MKIGGTTPNNKSQLNPFKLSSAEKKIQEIKKIGIAAPGRSELIAHLKSKRLYASKAIKAYCYDCMGYYADGKADCNQQDCPLHPFMHYAHKRNRLPDQLGTLPEKNGKGLVSLDVAKTEGGKK